MPTVFVRLKIIRISQEVKMIVTEIYQVRTDGVTLLRTYSDRGMCIQREGALYEEAVDPAYLNRQYAETDVPVPSRED